MYRSPAILIKRYISFCRISLSDIFRQMNLTVYDFVSDETEENGRLEKRDSWRHDRNERRRGTSFDFLNVFC